LGDIMKAVPPEGLGTASYIVDLVRPFIVPAILPVMVFIVASLMSFATGTSWGTWALMMPIAMPIAIAADVNLYLVAGAVLSGGAFGDHCSPISDTCILASMASNTNHMQHVRTQMPYAIAVGVAAVFGFLAAGIMGW
jgi:Na+/H+ antiporter NhaC